MNRINLKSIRPILASFLLILLIAAGCKKDNTTQEGSMKVRMTDAPADVEALVVNVTRVEAYLEGEGWVELATDVGEVDILSLSNGKEKTIANRANLMAGTYTMIRIAFGSDSWLEVNTAGVLVNHSLSIQSEAVIEADFVVEANSTTDILLDFQAGKSLIENAGSFFLDPVVTYIEDEETGAQGRLEGSASGYIEFNEDGGSATFEAYTNAEGQFLLRGIEEGVYDCIIYLKENGSNPPMITVENVTVVEGEITQMGTIQVQ